MQAVSRTSPPGRRIKMQDFIRVHEAPAAPGAILKRVRARVYEARGLLPLVVLSAFEDPVEHTTPDIERIGAEAVLEALDAIRTSGRG